MDELRRALFQELGPEGRLEYSVVVDQGNEAATAKTMHLPAARKVAAPEPGSTPPPANPYPGSARAASARYVAAGAATRPAVAVSAGSARAAVAQAATLLRNPFEHTRVVDGNLAPSQLNSAYTFDNYIEGGCNRLARSAGVAVANKPGTTSFQPR